MITKDESKSNDFISILNNHFQGKVNLLRLKLLEMFVLALCKVQTVGFEKLANAFDSEAMAASSLRRIQRFIAPYALSSDLIAKLIFGLLPHKENLQLSIYSALIWRVKLAQLIYICCCSTYFFTCQLIY